MKFNSEIKIGEINIPEMNVGLKDISLSIAGEYTFAELNAMYQLQKAMVKDLPGIIVDLKNAAIVFNECDKEYQDYLLRDEISQESLTLSIFKILEKATRK